MLVFSILDLKFKFFLQYRVAKHKRYLHKQNCFLRQKCHQTKEFRRRTIGFVNQHYEIKERYHA